MSNYQSLYRKWRPRDFESIVGQHHIVKTLQKSIESEKISHAYLFCGPRGTGKTTTARVLAKAMNCGRGPTVKPCNECPACVDITNGNYLDVIEIDAASNRGIDEVRGLRDSAKLVASSGNKKVYIIDEVHMLTTEAFNALLKLLEEPPGHVLFILATTEAHKILQTVISRCQRFDFKPISTSDVEERLKEVAKKEDISASDEAVHSIAKFSTGSLRDALSTLEQLNSFSDGIITQETVDQVLGTTNHEMLLRAVNVLGAGQPVDVITLISSLVKDGTNLAQFISDLIVHLRNLALLSNGGDAVDPTLLLKCNELNIAGIKEQSKAYDKDRIMQWCIGFSNAEGSIKDALDQRLRAETLFFEMQQPTESFEGIRERVSLLEARISALSGKSAAAPLPQAVPPKIVLEPPVRSAQKPQYVAPNVEEPPPAKSEKKEEIKPNTPVSSESENTARKGPEISSGSETQTQTRPDSDRDEWKAICDEAKKTSPAIHLMLAGCNASINKDELTLNFKAFARQHKEKLEANMKNLTDIVELVLERPVKIVCVVDTGDDDSETRVTAPEIKIIQNKTGDPKEFLQLVKEQLDAEIIEEN